MSKPTPYQILGVPASASEEEIKRAFRGRAKKLHPDRGGDPAQFAAASRAYALLMDKQRRDDYDATGNEAEANPHRPLVILMGAFHNAMVAYVGERTQDVRATCEAELRKAAREIPPKLAQLRRELARVEKLRGKIKRKGGDGQNMMAVQVEEAAKQINGAIAQLTAEADDIAKAIELLAGYEFPADEVNHNWPMQLSYSPRVEFNIV